MTLSDGFQLGDELTVYPLEGRLVVAGKDIHITPKTMDVLVCLAEADTGVVERDTLLRDVWGERAVSDEPLTRCIADLRKALGESRKAPRYVATVPKRGYRLLAPTKPLPVQSDRPAVATDAMRPWFVRASQWISVRRMLVGLFALVLAAVIQIAIERTLESNLDDAEPVAAERANFPTIAVLPFVDQTAAQDQAYFGDGLAVELTSLLATNPALAVTSNTSAFQFRNQAAAASEIGLALRVRHLVEGSVRRDGDMLRVAVQLVDTADGGIIWSAVFDETIGEIFAIQDRITGHIASALEISVLGDQASARQTRPEAFTLYLRARHEKRQGTQAAFELAIELLRDAVRIDPDYAPAWAEMADTYNNLSGQGFWAWDRGFRAAQDAAEKAITADPSYAGGHVAMAWVAHRYDGDLRKAFGHMRTALAINPSDVTVLPGAAVLALQAGRLDQAIDILRYCIRRSPTDPRLRYNLGLVYKYADRLDEARASFERTQALNPEYNGATYQLAETHLLLGETAKALEFWESLQGYNQLKGRAVSAFASGDVAGSNAALKELTDQWGAKWPGVVADVYAYRGELDAAFDWLDKDFNQYGAAGWSEVRLQRWYDPLRADPRWQALLTRAGLSPDPLDGVDLGLDLAAPP